jgi:hypothetical protein
MILKHLPTTSYILISVYIKNSMVDTNSIVASATVVKCLRHWTCQCTEFQSMNFSRICTNQYDSIDVYVEIPGKAYPGRDGDHGQGQCGLVLRVVLKIELGIR